MTHAAVLASVASQVPARSGPVLVAVDGVDGAGKTTFCADLAAALSPRVVVQASVDSFHHPSSVRWQRGRSSPEGFFLDSFDYSRFMAELLVPFRAGEPFRRAIHDVAAEAPVAAPLETVAGPAVLLVDGIFLHRDELAAFWDFSVFLSVDFPVSVARMAVRDGSPPSPDHPRNRRYVEGQQLYLAQCSPASRADLVIDYNDLADPRIVER